MANYGNGMALFCVEPFANPFWHSATGRRWSELPTKPQFLPPKSVVHWELTLWSDFTFSTRARCCCINSSLLIELKKVLHFEQLETPIPWKEKVSICGCQHTVFLPGRWLTLGIPPKQQLSESCMVIVGILLHLFHPSWVFLKLQDGVLKKARLQCCNVSMCTRATTHGAVAPTPAGCLGWGDCISFTSASQPAETFRLCRHRLRPDVGALLGGTKREANRGFEISEDWDC